MVMMPWIRMFFFTFATKIASVWYPSCKDSAHVRRHVLLLLSLTTFGKWLGSTTLLFPPVRGHVGHFWCARFSRRGQRSRKACSHCISVPGRFIVKPGFLVTVNLCFFGGSFNMDFKRIPCLVINISQGGWVDLEAAFAMGMDASCYL